VRPRSARRSGRCDLQVPIQIGDNLEPQIALTENIGTGGLFIATSSPGRIGERVSLKFRLPNATGLISVDGEIRWVRTSAVIANHGALGMGVRFTKLPLAVAATIQEFLREASSTAD
jgi:uncharacterized protein (TIGR02266 family)